MRTRGAAMCPEEIGSGVLNNLKGQREQLERASATVRIRSRCQYAMRRGCCLAHRAD